MRSLASVANRITASCLERVPLRDFGLSMPADRWAMPAYIARNGHIGPVAVTSEASSAEVIKAVLRRATEGRPQRLSMIVPGSADSVMDVLRELGFRIEEPFVLMSAYPFGNWRNYLPRTPGYL